METYLVVGKNQNGDEGSWEIKAEDEHALKKVLKDRSLEAKTINGEVVKRARPNPKEIDEDGVRSE